MPPEVRRGREYKSVPAAQVRSSLPRGGAVAWGGAAARALFDAARRDGNRTPLLFASGYSDPDRSGGSLDPSLPLLPKPWTGLDLLAHVREILDRNAEALP